MEVLAKRECTFSLDLQKAFDSVSWPYLFAVLQRWGFGPNFIGLLEALFFIPEAKVRLQGYYSERINIARGTRQGYPLSPLIFAIAIESLAASIQAHSDIGGFNVARCLISAPSSLTIYSLIYVNSWTTSPKYQVFRLISLSPKH